MNCHEYDTDIGEYVDGTLPPSRAAALEAHLSTCARCRAMIADFKVLRSAAASLERKMPPPQVWTRIAASLQAETPAAPPSRPFFTLFAWKPAIAASAIVAVLALGTWAAWREGSTSTPAPAVTSTTAADATPGTPPEATLQAPSQVLTQQIAHLEGIVTADDSVVPEETKAVYRTTTGVLDDAIGQSRAVLQEQPSNELAQESLFEALRSKLALLQDMVALINEMRKGNQEGAARIVSGMDK